MQETHDALYLTHRLNAWLRGEQVDENELFEDVYQRLKRIASAHLRRESGAAKVQTTVLVQMAYFELADAMGVQFNDREHFFAFSSRIMRRVLVDLARARTRQKRGGGVEHTSLDATFAEPSGTPLEDILSIHELLREFEKIDPVRSRLVELRFFGGLTIKEVAKIMRLSEATAYRHWRVARTWFHQALESNVSG